MNKIICYIFGGILLLSLPITAESANLSYGDNQVFPHGYIDYDGAGPLVLTDYPFALTGKSVVFQTSYRQLYEIRELTDSRFAFAISNARFGLGAAVALFGKPDYFQQLGLSVFTGYKINSISIGTSLVYQNMTFNDFYEKIGYAALNIAASYKIKTIRVFGVGMSVNQPAYYEGSERVPLEGILGLSCKTAAGLDNQFKLHFVNQRSPSGELSQSYALSGYANLNWALVLKPVRFGVGIDLFENNFGFDYKFSHHPVLGWTHQISLAVFK